MPGTGDIFMQEYEETKKTPIQSEADLTPHDLAMWGVEDVAYIRRSFVDGEETWTIHAAEGTQMGVAETKEIAEAMIRQNDLEPSSVH
jgi:hypothetical protein